MRTQLLLPLAALTTAFLLGGCSGMSNTSDPTGRPITPMRIDFNENGFILPDVTKAVGVRLQGEKGVKSKVYGQILGYFNGTKSTITQIVTIKHGSKVVFHNVDTLHPHTASLLGTASKQGANWPSQFDGSVTQSAAGTDIASSSFSTGTLNQGQNSLTYVANTVGYYMFGCGFHYNSNGMRDIIIVQ